MYESKIRVIRFAIRAIRVSQYCQQPLPFGQMRRSRDLGGAGYCVLPRRAPAGRSFFSRNGPRSSTSRGDSRPPCGVADSLVNDTDERRLFACFLPAADNCCSIKSSKRSNSSRWLNTGERRVRPTCRRCASGSTFHSLTSKVFSISIFAQKRYKSSTVSPLKIYFLPNGRQRTKSVFPALVGSNAPLSMALISKSNPAVKILFMKIFCITVLVALFAWATAPAQSCLPEGITFDTQGQVDSFPINYPGCQVIEGDVAIRDSFIDNYVVLDAITNLAGLSNIHTIGGKLTIFRNEQLANLQGLHNLASIGDTLYIYGNDSLHNLLILGNLTLISRKCFKHI